MSLATLFHFLCAHHVHQELATILLNYHIRRIVLGSMCAGVSMWLGWSGTRVAGFNMFRTLIYPSSGACDYPVELPHWLYCSWFDVCCRLKPATRIPLQPNHTEIPTHIERGTIRPMW